MGRSIRSEAGRSRAEILRALTKLERSGGRLPSGPQRHEDPSDVGAAERRPARPRKPREGS